MKIYVIEAGWRLDNSTESGEKFFALSLENAKKKFFEVRESTIKDFNEWYGEKDEIDFDGDWLGINSWNIIEDAGLNFACANSDGEVERVELYSQETID